MGSVAADDPLRNGSSISPAPWALAIRNDHSTSSSGRIRNPTQRGCFGAPASRSRMRPGRSRRRSARWWRDTVPQPNQHRHRQRDREGMADRDRHERARPAPARDRSCSASATANSQPIAGLMPWKAPSPAIPARSPRSREAVRVRRRVAALEPHLVRDAAVELRSPGTRGPASIPPPSARRPAWPPSPSTPVRVELLVPAGVEPVGDVDALAVPRRPRPSAGRRSAAVPCGRCAARRGNPAQAHASGLASG